MENEKYEDLLLSITEPIDRERRKPVKSEIETNKQNTNIDPVTNLSSEKEEKIFYQKMVSLFAPEKQMKQIRIDKTDYLDVVGKKYIIRRPLKEANWAIYEDKEFLVRIRMIQKNKYQFKVYNHIFSRLNLSPELSELIKEKIEVTDKFCKFILDYQSAVLILDDFYNIGESKRNTILSNVSSDNKKEENSYNENERTNSNCVQQNRQDELLSNIIKELSLSKEGLKARELAYRLKADKTDINSILYRNKDKIFVIDDSYVWRLI